jgi:hypothetical protein
MRARNETSLDVEHSDPAALAKQVQPLLNDVETGWLQRVDRHAQNLKHF